LIVCTVVVLKPIYLCVTKIITHALSLTFSLIFFARQYTDATRDIDIAILSVCLSVCPSVRPYVRPSVRDALVFDENGLTYGHSFFTVR